VSRDRASALVWLSLAGLVAVQSYALKLGTLHQPGPGFFPFWGAVLLGILSVVLLVGPPSRRVSDSASGARSARARAPVVVAGGLLAYVLLLEPVGFVIVTFLFLLFLFRLVRRGWLVSGLVALTGTAACYALFQLWLKSQLPRGPLGF
jgi:putative tricarboxylic transport membrane protein